MFQVVKIEWKTMDVTVRQERKVDEAMDQAQFGFRNEMRTINATYMQITVMERCYLKTERSLRVVY